MHISCCPEYELKPPKCESHSKEVLLDMKLQFIAVTTDILKCCINNGKVDTELQAVSFYRNSSEVSRWWQTSFTPQKPVLESWHYLITNLMQVTVLPTTPWISLQGLYRRSQLVENRRGGGAGVYKKSPNNPSLDHQAQDFRQTNPFLFSKFF